MLFAWLILALAGANEPAPAPTCALTSPSALPQRLSVVWLAPASRMAMGSTLLTVVPTRDLRTWIASEKADLSRVLVGLGLKRTLVPTKRTWQAVVFDVSRDELCRPIDGLPPGTEIGGVVVCPHADKHIAGKHDTCGHAIDRVLDAPSLDLLHIRWRDAATHGFCVLPAARFVRGE